MKKLIILAITTVILTACGESNPAIPVERIKVYKDGQAMMCPEDNYFDGANYVFDECVPEEEYNE